MDVASIQKKRDSYSIQDLKQFLDLADLVAGVEAQCKKVRELERVSRD